MTRNISRIVIAAMLIILSFEVSCMHTDAQTIKCQSEKRSMDEAIMMQAGDVGEPYFDATQWFTSGMYKRRKEVQMEKEFYSDVSMFRVTPPPFDSKDNDVLLMRAAGALRRNYPKEEKDWDYLYEIRPDLHHRMIYSASGFDAPNKPIDIYHLYLTIGEKCYTIDFSRDGITGEIKSVSSALLIKKDNEAKMKIFREFEEKEHKHMR